MTGQKDNHSRLQLGTAFLRLAIISSVAISLLVVFQQSGTLHGPRGADAAFIGDANCDADVDAEDVIALLQDISDIRGSDDCAPSMDVDCDTETDVADAMRILRFLAYLAQATIADCAGIDAVSEGTTNQQLAADLALRVTGAATDDAQYRALLKVMAVLRIGVYSEEGFAVVQGAERGPGDFYFYDFEMHMLAASLSRGDNGWGIQAIADTLDQVGYREDGLPFTAADLNQIVHDATNDSLAAPDEESSLLPLLVRELGLRAETPYDLADELDMNEARFDGLQATLILTALTLPVIAEEGPLDTPASTLIADSDGILTAQPMGPIDTCGDFRSEGQELWPTTKFFLTAVSVVSNVGKRVVGFIDIGHGSVLAFSVRVKALEDDGEGSTHYDHGPADPGRNLKFRVEVRMLDDLGEILVKCGWLATADFPPKGPISGVRVSYQKQVNDYLELRNHGTLDCTGLFCSRITDSNGVATLTFDPKSETAPYGEGTELIASGDIEGIAWYQSKFRNIFGTLAQFVTPKSDAFAWSVGYHGCALDVPAQSASAPDDGVSAQAFGDVVSIQAITSLDQLPCTWTGTGHASIHHTLGDWDETGEISGTVTFGNPQLAGNTVTYEVTSGSSAWQGSEAMPPICSFSGSGTYEGAQGSLIVTDTGSGLTYSGLASGSFGDPEPGGCFGLFDLDNGPFFHTCSGNWALTDLVLSGSCDVDAPSGYDDQYEWTLNGISCSGSGLVTPQGTCGGAAVVR